MLIYYFRPWISASTICLGTKWTDWALTSDVCLHEDGHEPEGEGSSTYRTPALHHSVCQALSFTLSLLILEIILENHKILSKTDWRVCHNRNKWWQHRESQAHTSSSWISTESRWRFPLQRVFPLQLLKRSLPLLLLGLRSRRNSPQHRMCPPRGPPAILTETGMGELRHILTNYRRRGT